MERVLEHHRLDTASFGPSRPDCRRQRMSESGFARVSRRKNAPRTAMSAKLGLNDTSLPSTTASRSLYTTRTC